MSKKKKKTLARAGRFNDRSSKVDWVRKVLQAIASAEEYVGMDPRSSHAVDWLKIMSYGTAYENSLVEWIEKR